MTAVTVEQLRREAAEMLEWGDWAQSDDPAQDPAEGHCLLTALQSAWIIHADAAANTAAATPPDELLVMAAERQIAAELGVEHRDEMSGWAGLAVWNDMPGRTMTEVVDALKGGTDVGTDTTG